MTVLIIAEAGSSHDNDLQKAYRLIEAAKECGADAVKFQWTSNAAKMAQRRDAPVAENMYRRYLEKPVSWLESLKAHADKVGIEFMCTVYLIEDIATIAPMVKRFKVSAYESDWREFVEAHFYQFKDTIISSKHASEYPISMKLPGSARPAYVLHCVSKYPTTLEDLHLRECSYEGVDGLSDHTANVLTGAAAVAAGAKIVEAHIRLGDTSPNNPDYGHSLEAPCVTCGPYGDPQGDWGCDGSPNCFRKYVANIRTVERML